MKAIGFNAPFNLEDGNQFQEIEFNIPNPTRNQLLIKVQSISVNPVDTKQRILPVNHAPRILGFDAAGIVEQVGEDVTMFEPGDYVFYSGSPNQHGSNEEYQLIEEELVAKAPSNLKPEQAASLPLTGLTASETLFDLFQISHDPEKNKGKSLLIINGAGGVGSITTQIAKAHGLKVITTASREETIEWTKSMGADIVINHKEDLKTQLEHHDINEVDYIFCTFDTDLYYEKMIELIKPLGHIATIVAFKEKQDLNLLKPKSVNFTHEFMFARPVNRTNDMIKHHEYLKDISERVEQGQYHHTTTKVINGLTTETLYQAHQILESNTMIGKLVINVEK